MAVFFDINGVVEIEPGVEWGIGGVRERDDFITVAATPDWDIDGVIISDVDLEWDIGGVIAFEGEEGGDIGTVYWGHVTGVVEDFARTFLNNWTGTGEISGSGDTEIIKLFPGEYMESEVWELGSGSNATIVRDKYASGSGTPAILYKTATTAGALPSGWTSYTGSFESSGFVQIRVNYS